MSSVDEKSVSNEDLNDKLDVILEYVSEMPDIKIRLTNIEEDIVVIKSDVQVIKGVIRVHTSDIADHKSKSHSH